MTTEEANDAAACAAMATERKACAEEVRKEIESAKRHLRDSGSAVAFLGYALKHIEERGATPVALPVFSPTAAELAACPVLSDAAGKSEREAIIALAKEIALWRQATPAKIQPILDRFAAKVGVVGPLPGKQSAAVAQMRDAIGLVLNSVPCAKLKPILDAFEVLRDGVMSAGPPRPRIGPWVDRGCHSWGRFDDRGVLCGSLCHFGEAVEWWAVRPFADRAEGQGSTDGEARAAVDAVLATWADLDCAAVAQVGSRAGERCECVGPHEWDFIGDPKERHLGRSWREECPPRKPLPNPPEDPQFRP